MPRNDAAAPGHVCPRIRIQAIDMGRRTLHDEGSRVLLERLKGKITVEFASVDDLERIVGLIAPQLAKGINQANEP